MKWNTKRFTLLAVGLLSFSALAQSALAAPNVFFARDEAIGASPNSAAKYAYFTSLLHSYGLEDVEDDAGFDPELEFVGTSITATAGGTLPQAAPGFMFDDQALVESDAVGFPQVNTVFTFNQYITAFGLHVIQGGDDTNDNPTTFRLKDTVANTSVDVQIQVGPDWGLTNVYFLGLADTVPFNEVEIIEAGDFADGQLYDNLVAGFVPEPGSLALLMLGGVCAVGRAFRFRRR